MPQEFQVLQCYKCSTFQVHQVKKATKWNCKLCGEKQSIKKVYGRGSGAECRCHVQKLNSLRGEIAAARELQTALVVSGNQDNDFYDDNKESCSYQHTEQGNDIGKARPSNSSGKWSKYMDCVEEEDEGDEDDDDGMRENDIVRYTTSREQCNAFNKRNRKRKRPADEAFHSKWVRHLESRGQLSNWRSQGSSTGRRKESEEACEDMYTSKNDRVPLQDGEDAQTGTCPADTRNSRGLGHVQQYTKWGRNSNIRKASTSCRVLEEDMNTDINEYQKVADDGRFEMTPASTVSEHPHSSKYQNNWKGISNDSKRNQATSTASKWDRFINEEEENSDEEEENEDNPSFSPLDECNPPVFLNRNNALNNATENIQFPPCTATDRETLQKINVGKETASPPFRQSDHNDGKENIHVSGRGTSQEMSSLFSIGEVGEDDLVLDL